jgi:hypothetical protein
MKKIIILLISLLFLTLSVIVEANEIRDIVSLIKFNVVGTSIDIIPDHIDLIVQNPQEQMQLLLKQRRTVKVQIPNTVNMYGTLITFFKPSDYPSHSVGDVIYKFLVESEDEKAQFINKHQLKLHAVREELDGYKLSEYLSQPGYYVTFQLKQRDIFVMNILRFL